MIIVYWRKLLICSLSAFSKDSGLQKNRLIAAAILLGATRLAFSTESHAAASSSTAYQVDPAHDGNLTLSGFAPPLKLLWSKTMKGNVSYPVVANGIVFVTVRTPATNNNSASYLWAIDIHSGKNIWKKLVDKSYSSNAAAAYDNGYVFAATASARVIAITADATGSVLYSTQPLSLYGFGSAIAKAGSLYVVSNGQLYSIEEGSGNIQWKGGVSGAAEPILGLGGLYLVPSCNYTKYNPLTGKQIWTNYFGCTGGSEDSAYFSNRVYVRDGLGDVVLDAGNGKVVGVMDADETPAFYQNSSGGQFEYEVLGSRLYGVNLATGNISWDFGGDGQLSSAPIVVNGMVVEGSTSGELYLLNGANGTLLWSTNVGSPILGERSGPLAGLGGGDGVLIVPASQKILAFSAN